LNGNRIGMLVGDGLLEPLPGGRIAATARGAPVLNAVVAELAA
jgi:oxygen-independent coproporphyrinogen-3 oxidase